MEIKDLNQGKIIGAVVHKYRPKPNTLILSLITNRRSKANFPNVLILGKETEAADQALRKGSRVSISGHIQTQKKVMADGKIVYRQSIVCDEYKLLQSKMTEAFGNVEGIRGTYPADEDIFELKGTVEHIFTPDRDSRVAVLTIRTETGRISFPKVSCFGETAKFVREGKVQEGDRICIIASIQSDRKESGGEVRYFETLVCEDIAIE